jgi:hypothetical protein
MSIKKLGKQKQKNREFIDIPISFNGDQETVSIKLLSASAINGIYLDFIAMVDSGTNLYEATGLIYSRMIERAVYANGGDGHEPVFEKNQLDHVRPGELQKLIYEAMLPQRILYVQKHGDAPPEGFGRGDASEINLDTLFEIDDKTKKN